MGDFLNIGEIVREVKSMLSCGMTVEEVVISLEMDGVTTTVAMESLKRAAHN